MNYLERLGYTPIIGTVGAFGTWSITIINEYVALAIGVVTLVYTVARCIDLFRQMRKK